MQTKAFLSLGWNCVLLTAIPLGLGCHLECTGQKKKKRMYWTNIHSSYCCQSPVYNHYVPPLSPRSADLLICTYFNLQNVHTMDLGSCSHGFVTDFHVVSEQRLYSSLIFLCFRFGALFLLTFHWSN